MERSINSFNFILDQTRGMPLHSISGRGGAMENTRTLRHHDLTATSWGPASFSYPYVGSSVNHVFHKARYGDPSMRRPDSNLFRHRHKCWKCNPPFYSLSGQEVTWRTIKSCCWIPDLRVPFFGASAREVSHIILLLRWHNFLNPAQDSDIFLRCYLPTLMSVIISIYASGRMYKP